MGKQRVSQRLSEWVAASFRLKCLLLFRENSQQSLFFSFPFEAIVAAYSLC